MSEDVIARLSPTMGRRVLAVFGLAFLGLICANIALQTVPRVPAVGAFMLALAAFSYWCAWVLWQATSTSIVLTSECLREESGAMITRLDNIASIEKGLFAFKPSNGFVLRLKEPAPKAWRPGLWWSTGRSIGVGGVTSAAAGKMMAETLSSATVSEPRPPVS